MDPSGEVHLSTSPPAWSLPTLSPWCLAAESALRFARIDFERDVAATAEMSILYPLEQRSCLPSLRVSPEASAPREDAAAVRHGVDEILNLLEVNNRSLDQFLSDAERGVSAAVRALVLNEMFPCIAFFGVGNPSCFSDLVTATLSKQKERRWWHASFESQRIIVVRWLRERHGLESLDAAISRFHAAAKSIEYLYREFALRQASAAAAEVKGKSTMKAGAEPEPVRCFLGHTTPTSADCFVFSAASSVLHANYPAGAGALRQLQKALRTDCTHLAGYAEQLRRQFFDSFSGWYKLRAVPTVDPAALTNEALFHPGRMRTVLTTTIFATVFFLWVNAAEIVAALELNTLQQQQRRAAEAEKAQQHREGQRPNASDSPRSDPSDGPRQAPPPPTTTAASPPPGAQEAVAPTA